MLGENLEALKSWDALYGQEHRRLKDEADRNCIFFAQLGAENADEQALARYGALVDFIGWEKTEEELGNLDEDRLNMIINRGSQEEYLKKKQFRDPSVAWEESAIAKFILEDSRLREKKYKMTVDRIAILTGRTTLQEVIDGKE